MRIEYFSKENFPEESYAELVKRLYANQSPRISKGENLHSAIGIFEENEVQALVSLYDNPSHPEYLILGQYESVNDDKVQRSILEATEKVKQELGKDKLLGPMNGSTWHPYRFRTGKAKPYFMEAVHQDYYYPAWKDFGFQTFATYQTNIDQLNLGLKLPDYSAYFEEKGLVSRSMNVAEPIRELQLIHAFCMELFQENVLFSPISEKDFLSLYHPVLPMLDPRFIDLVYDQDDLVGLFFAIPDILNSERIVVKTIARHPEEKYRGLAHMMSAQFYQKALQHGFKEMLNVYFHVSNASSRVSENFGGKMHQQYELLVK